MSLMVNTEVDRLRKLAAEVRDAAARTSDPSAKRVLLFIAAAYDRLIRFAQKKDGD